MSPPETIRYEIRVGEMIVGVLTVTVEWKMSLDGRRVTATLREVEAGDDAEESDEKG